MVKNADEIKQHLLKYPDPKFVIVTTLADGYGSCIKPVPTICGAEIHCNKNTLKYIKDFL